MSLTYAELFAGAGGLSMGLEVAGFHCVAHAEIEPHARAVLRKHWPDCRLDGDVTQINGADYRGITLLSGGSPCQDLSVAGKRAGLVGSRSSLFHEQCRIWRESEAPYLLWENVYGAFSSNGGKDFATVLSTLVGATIAVPADGWSSGGVAAGCDAVAAWRVLDLQHFGPPQRRVRVFVLAARAGGVDPAEVLALSEGVCGHPSPRERSRQIAAGHAAGGVGGGVIPYTASSFAEYEEGVRQLRAAGGDLGGGSETILAFHHRQTPISGDVSPAIGRTTDGMGVMSFGRSSFGGWDGQDVASPVCTHDAKETTSILVMAHGQANASVDLDGCPTLTALHEAPIIVGALCAEDSVKWGTDQWARQNKIITSQTYSTPAIGDIRVDDVASTITKHTGGGGETQNPAFVVEPILPTLAMGAHTAAPGGNGQDALQIQQTLAASGVGRPRRLTPLECERLMSWPDQWTATGRKEDGTLYALSDTARYRLCGNGVGSVCAEWIATRLADAIAAQQSTPTRAAP